jgi:hypothetical protein
VVYESDEIVYTVLVLVSPLGPNPAMIKIWSPTPAIQAPSRPNGNGTDVFTVQPWAANASEHVAISNIVVTMRNLA